MRAALDAATAGRVVYGTDDEGDVTFIGGTAQRPLQAASEEGIEAVGRTFVDEYAPLFGAADGRASFDRADVPVVDGSDGGAVRYDQSIDGVPVIAGQIAVQIGVSGAVLSATGETTSRSDLDTVPTVTADAAAASAVAVVARASGVDVSVLRAGQPELSIYDPSLLGLVDPLGTRLVWHFDVRTDLGDIDHFVLIDAHDGTIALEFDQTEATRLPTRAAPSRPPRRT